MICISGVLDEKVKFYFKKKKRLHSRRLVFIKSITTKGIHTGCLPHAFCLNSMEYFSEKVSHEIAILLNHSQNSSILLQNNSFLHPQSGKFCWFALNFKEEKTPCFGVALSQINLFGDLGRDCWVFWFSDFLQFSNFPFFFQNFFSNENQNFPIEKSLIKSINL